MSIWFNYYSCVVCLDELFYKYNNFKSFFKDEFNSVKDQILNKSEVILNYIHKNVLYNY